MSSDQMGLDLGGPRLQKRDNRFKGENLLIAARPDRAAVHAAQAIARDYRDLYRIDRQPLSERRMHVSLFGLDHAPVLEKSLIADARAAIDALRFQPFEITLDSVVSLKSAGGGRPVGLASSRPNLALRSMLARLSDKLDGFGIPHNPDPDLLVHMTLIHYDKPVMPEILTTPIRWTVDQLWLVKSLVGQGIHEFLWPDEKRPDA